MNEDISNAYLPSSVDNCRQKTKKQSSEQGYAIFGLCLSAFSLFAAVAIYGVAYVWPSLQTFYMPELLFVVCIPPSCAGVLVSFWALIFRPGRLPIIGIVAGTIAMLVGLWLGYSLSWARFGS